MRVNFYKRSYLSINSNTAPFGNLMGQYSPSSVCGQYSYTVYRENNKTHIPQFSRTTHEALIVNVQPHPEVCNLHSSFTSDWAQKGRLLCVWLSLLETSMLPPPAVLMSRINQTFPRLELPLSKLHMRSLRSSQLSKRGIIRCHR